jgi:hypothetical protein
MNKNQKPGGMTKYLLLRWSSTYDLLLNWESCIINHTLTTDNQSKIIHALSTSKSVLVNNASIIIIHYF